MLIRLLLIIFAFLFSENANANFASFQASTYTAPADVVCNFITGVATGVGAGTCVTPLPTCNGVTDDTASFDAFALWANGTWQATHTGLIELYIPPGACSLTTFAITFDGIKKLRISGYGVTLNGTYFHLGGSAQWQDGLHSTRILQANAGVTSVIVNPTSLTQPNACNSNATCTALFTVGGWGLVAGFDLQSGSGFPSNPAYFQYVHITSIDSVTGVITFDTPLTDTYLTTWPNYNNGTDFSGEPDDGGPATLYAFKSGWDIEIEWRGVTFTSNTQIDGSGRNVIFRDTTWTQNLNSPCFPCGLFFSMNYYANLISSTLLATTLEFDKIVENANFSRVVINAINFQSANKNFSFDNSTITNFNGLPANTTITNSIVTNQLSIGPTLYGRGNTLRVNNTSVGSIGTNGSGANNTLTISNASPAIFSSVSHGLTAGSQVQFYPAAGGNLPSPLISGNFYYVIATGLTANAFEVSTSIGGSAINTTSVGSGAFAFATNGGQSHANYGAFFSGLNSGSTGFQNIPGLSVSSGVIGIPNAFIKQHSSDLNVMGWAQPGTNSCWSYDTNTCSGPIFQIQSVAQDGKGNGSTAITISNASPAVVGMTGHGRVVGDIVAFYGTLPSPLVANTLYYVIAAGLTANAFEISATLGGAAINTTTTGSGIFLITTGKTYITTNMVGGVLPTVSSGNLTIRNVPNIASYFNGCSVSLDCIGLNEAAAQGKPIGTYSKRTYANAQTGDNAPYWPIFGNLQKLNIAVNTTYSGAPSATMTPNTLFGLYLNSLGADVSYTPAVINLKTAGTRSLNATGGYPAVWSGSAGFPFAGDTLQNLLASKFATVSWRSLSTDITIDPGNPMSVTVEVVTDMGLVVP